MDETEKLRAQLDRALEVLKKSGSKLENLIIYGLPSGQARFLNEDQYYSSMSSVEEVRKILDEIKILTL